MRTSQYHQENLPVAVTPADELPMIVEPPFAGSIITGTVARKVGQVPLRFTSMTVSTEGLCPADSNSALLY